MFSRRLFIAALICVSAALTAGCEKSHIKADANVRLSGKVVTAGGGPAGGIGVSLLKQPDAGEVIGGLTVGIATVGLVCAVDSPPAICRSVRHTVTGGDGHFSYELRGSDTQGSIGNADTLNVSAAAPGSGGAATSVAFRVQHERVALPALRLWDAQLKLDATTLTPDWRPLPADGSADTTLLFTDGQGTPVWEQANPQSGRPFDARLLEDAAVVARVRADTAVNRRTGSYKFQYFSSDVHLNGPAGAADSRGASCVIPRRGAVQGVPGRPCWLTDGDLGHGASPQEPRHSVAVIDLGSQKAISLIAVRGEAAARTISVSSDGRSFRPLATRDGAFEQLTPRGLQARYVRLQVSGSTDHTDEFSIWTD
jgi:hypothetical protein